MAERIRIVWEVTERHELTYDVDELFDEFVEQGLVEPEAPRTPETLEALRGDDSDELESWLAEQEDSSTYYATESRDVMKIKRVAARVAG